MKSKTIVPYLQVAPLAIVLFLFLAMPMALVAVVSVFRNKLFVGLVPAFTFENYFDIFSNLVNYQLYFSTIKFTIIVLAMSPTRPARCAMAAPTKNASPKSPCGTT